MGTEIERRLMEWPGTGKSAIPWRVQDCLRDIHLDYVAAGATVLLSSTFGISLNKLEAESKVKDTRSAAGPDRWVLGDVSPWDEGIPVRALAAGLRSFASADGILFETFSDIAWFDRLRELRQDALVLDDLPVLVSMTFHHSSSEGLTTFANQSPEDVARAANNAGIAALGVNCGKEIDMDDIIEIVRRYRYCTNLPLFARPNAGTPIREDNRWRYPRTPRMMADRLPELLEAGVAMVGGCCGTTPDHIAAFREVVDAWNQKRNRDAL